MISTIEVDQDRRNEWYSELLIRKQINSHESYQKKLSLGKRRHIWSHIKSSSISLTDFLGISSSSSPVNSRS